MNSLPLLLVVLTGQVALLALLVCAIDRYANRDDSRQSANLLFAGVLGCLVLTILIFAPLPSWLDFRPTSSSPRADSMLVSDIVDVEPPQDEKGSLDIQDQPITVYSAVALAPPKNQISRSPSISFEAVHSALTNRAFRLILIQIPWWFSLAFVVMAGLASIRLTCSIWSLHVTLRDSQPVDDEFYRRFLDAAQRMEIAGDVSLRVSSAVATAATIGWRKPVILLGDQYSCWTSRQLEDVFTHELAHVKHNDFFKHVVCQMVTAVHFGNPFIHWLARRLSFSQELAADRVASDLNPDTYSRSLAELALSSHGNPMIVLGFFNRPAFISRRITMLQNNIPIDSRRRIRGLSLIAVVVAIALAGFRLPNQASTDLPVAQTNLHTSSSASADHPTPANLSSPQEPSDENEVPWHERALVKPDNFVITVKDAETKQPIPAASIIVWGIDRSDNKSIQTLMEVQTDEHGQFRFQDLQAQYPTADKGRTGPEIVLGIKKEGFATTVVQPTSLVPYLENPAAFSISLLVAEGLKGRVVDDNGSPIVGAKVWKHVYLNSPIEGFYSETDETGHFWIKDSVAFRENWIGDDGVMATMFLIDHPEFGQSYGSVTLRPPNDGLIQFKLSRVFTVSGRVVGASNAPVEKIQIRAYPIHSLTFGASPSDDFTRTEPSNLVSIPDEQGKFSFRLPSKAEYYLTQIDPEQKFGAPAVKVGEGPVQGVSLPEIRVEPMVAVEGYVVDHETKDKVVIDDSLEIHLLWHGVDFPKGISPVRGVLIEPDGSFIAMMVPGRNFPYISTVTKGKKYSSKNKIENGIIITPSENEPLVMELNVSDNKDGW